MEDNGAEHRETKTLCSPGYWANFNKYANRLNHNNHHNHPSHSDHNRPSSRKLKTEESRTSQLSLSELCTSCAEGSYEREMSKRKFSFFLAVSVEKYISAVTSNRCPCLFAACEVFICEVEDMEISSEALLRFGM